MATFSLTHVNEIISDIFVFHLVYFSPVGELCDEHAGTGHLDLWATSCCTSPAAGPGESSTDDVYRHIDGLHSRLHQRPATQIPERTGTRCFDFQSLSGNDGMRPFFHSQDI